MMMKKERQIRYERLLKDLDKLREEWQSESVEHKEPVATSRRERFKLAEAETSLLRLMQAESRLKQQILLGLVSFFGGSAITLLIRHFLID